MHHYKENHNERFLKQAEMEKKNCKFKKILSDVFQIKF